MMPKEKILVTGATGNVGSRILKLLIDAGFNPVAALPDINEAKKLPTGTDFRTLQFDGNKDAGPFQDIRKVFLMRPPHISDVKKYMFPSIDAAIDAGVRHFVLLSLQGAEHNGFVPHRKLELYLLSKKIQYTFLRPSFFMQNLSTTHLKEIRDRDEIYVPAGNGRTAFIDVNDIACIAYKALTEPGHENKAYEITGNDSLTYAEVAKMLSGELNRTITYKKPNVVSFIVRNVKNGIKLEFSVIMAAIYTVCALGKAETTTGTFKELTGREPVSMLQFIKENRSVWLR